MVKEFEAKKKKWIRKSGKNKIDEKKVKFSLWEKKTDRL